MTNLKQCVDNAACKHSNCECNHGWRLDEATGLCLGTHGTVCSTDANCLVSHYFQCGEGKCDCDKNHTHFNEISDSCYGIATDTQCVNNQNCDRSDQQKDMCTCTRGFEEENKNCYGTRGTSCSFTDECFRPQMLTCLEGSCGCNSASEEWQANQCKL